MTEDYLGRARLFLWRGDEVCNASITRSFDTVEVEKGQPISWPIQVNKSPASHHESRSENIHRLRTKYITMRPVHKLYYYVIELRTKRGQSPLSAASDRLMEEKYITPTNFKIKFNSSPDARIGGSVIYQREKRGAGVYSLLGVLSAARTSLSTPSE